MLEHAQVMYFYFQEQRKWHIAKLVETGKEDDAPVAIPDDNGAVSGGSKGRSKSRKREEHTPVGIITIYAIFACLPSTCSCSLHLHVYISHYR